MAEKISLLKNTYSKTQFNNTVDTSFSQLTTTGEPSTPAVPSITVDEFFKSYQDLFFQIPREGITNSHRYLINTSTDYVGSDNTNSEIQALLEEINSLREQLLSQQQLLQTLRSTQDISNPNL